jgi:(S)-2-hydroxy-acid oxidase
MRSCADFEILAKEKLSKNIYDFIAQGAGDESTIAANRDALDRIKLRPRVLEDVSVVDGRTSILGASCLPIIIAPTIYHQMVNSSGKEIATAKSAEAMQTIMIVSTCANTTLEEIAESTKGILWFQLYMTEERSLTENLIKRADAAGYKALVLTVDTAIKGNRRRDIANNFEFPKDCKLANFSDKDLALLVKNKNTNNEDLYKSVKFSAALNWSDIAWIKTITDLPIIIKGIMHPEDARLALQHGAAGIVISNHGGRQLEGVMGTLDALPDIVDVIQQRVPIFIDGGFRSGSDIFKAIAMGATAVLIGRPVLYALAVNKVSELLEYLQKDFQLAMGLMRCISYKEIQKEGPSLIVNNSVSQLSSLEKSLTGKIEALERQIKSLVDNQAQVAPPSRQGFKLFGKCCIS